MVRKIEIYDREAREEKVGAFKIFESLLSTSKVPEDMGRANVVFLGVFLKG